MSEKYPYHYSINDSSELFNPDKVMVIEFHSARYDLEDMMDRETLASVIAERIHDDGGSGLNWPISITLYDKNKVRVAIVEVDMHLEPSYDSIEIWSEQENG